MVLLSLFFSPPLFFPFFNDDLDTMPTTASALVEKKTPPTNLQRRVDRLPKSRSGDGRKFGSERGRSAQESREREGSATLKREKEYRRPASPFVSHRAIIRASQKRSSGRRNLTAERRKRKITERRRKKSPGFGAWTRDPASATGRVFSVAFGSSVSAQTRGKSR